MPFHVSHIPERFTLFTIIALGETVVLVATGTAPGHLPPEAVFAAVCGFLIAACLWWVYFAFADAAPLGSGRLAPQTYAYGHLLVFAGITATGGRVQADAESVRVREGTAVGRRQIEQIACRTHP